MSIILRTNKGSALTYDEMDRNQSQFFYSSSLHDTKIRLHYTGSDSLTTTEDYGPTRYHEIEIGGSTTTTTITNTIAGDNTQIQFNNNGEFGASSNLVFDHINKLIGIGTASPQDRLDIQGSASQPAAITLRGFSGTANENSAKVNFNEGSTLIGKVGRTDGDNSNLYIVNNKQLNGSTYGQVHIGTGPDGDDDSITVATFSGRSSYKPRFGINTKTPNRQGTFCGAEGIGISSTAFNVEQSILQPIPSVILQSSTSTGLSKLRPHQSHPAGLLIASPEDSTGGNVIVAINSDLDKKEGFNIINGFAGDYSNSEVIATFQASGKVGINTNFPEDTGLTVDGIISGSGNLSVEGTATVGDIATGTADNTSAVVATSTGLIQKIAAAPVPLGGIIMWSGTIANIPNGWTLCNGSGGANDITVPDLRDKFIVGATADGAGAVYPGLEGGSTGGSENAVIVSHSHSTTVTDPGHFHVAGAANGNSNSQAPSPFEFTNDDREAEIQTDSAQTGILVGVNETGVDGANKNLPPYYALAFIIYVGA